MKLKKIAALALAGVMAVSMLAGCGTDKKPGTGEGEGEGTVTTTGYSASVEKAMDLDKDTYDYISFKDNSTDQAALEKAVAGMSTQKLEDIAANFGVPTDVNTSKSAPVQTMLTELKTSLDLDKDIKLSNVKFTEQTNNTMKAGVVYAFNGGVATDYALGLIADNVKKVVNGTNYPETANLGGVTCNYSYTVSVSAVTRAQQANYTAATNSTTFVLVTVTRTATI